MHVGFYWIEGLGMKREICEWWQQYAHFPFQSHDFYELWEIWNVYRDDVDDDDRLLKLANIYVWIKSSNDISVSAVKYGNQTIELKWVLSSKQ